MTTELNNLVTYSVPEWNIPVLESRIIKMNKRAVKLGCDPLVLTTHKIETISDPHFEGESKDAPLFVIHIISIDGVAPKLNGWKFVGTLDHVSLPGTVMVHTVPGEKVPEEFFTHDGTCNHCNKIRRRNETFVVENEQHEHLAVGRNCIRDFLGHNPQGLVGYLDQLDELFNDIKNDNLGGSGGPSFYHYNLNEFLAYTAAVIRINGWTPRSAANIDEGRPATADIVAHLVNPPLSTYASLYDEWKKAVVKYDPTADDIQEAVNSIEWVKMQEPNNEFIHNLQAIVRANTVVGKLFGYAAAIISAYQRANEKLRLRMSNLASIVNEYVGETGMRITVDVVLKQVRYFDSNYGTVTMHEFRDMEGHVLIWMSNVGKLDHDIGQQFRIIGSIKKHNLYNDTKQTVLTRVREVAV